jgi:hypothetical protein
MISQKRKQLTASKICEEKCPLLIKEIAIIILLKCKMYYYFTFTKLRKVKKKTRIKKAMGKKSSFT